jgi:hypothetical protein
MKWQVNGAGVGAGSESFYFCISDIYFTASVAAWFDSVGGLQCQSLRRSERRDVCAWRLLSLRAN